MQEKKKQQEGREYNIFHPLFTHLNLTNELNCSSLNDADTVDQLVIMVGSRPSGPVSSLRSASALLLLNKRRILLLSEENTHLSLLLASVPNK